MFPTHAHTFLRHLTFGPSMSARCAGGEPMVMEATRHRGGCEEEWVHDVDPAAVEEVVREAATWTRRRSGNQSVRHRHGPDGGRGSRGAGAWVVMKWYRQVEGLRVSHGIKKKNSSDGRC
jgi:hypothetical protein